MKKITLLLGILLIVSCSPKADIDAYVKNSCECIDKISFENEDKASIAGKLNGCFDFANNQEVYQELITQYLNDNPEAGYVEAEQNAPKIIEAKLTEGCPSYKKFTEQ